MTLTALTDPDNVGFRLVGETVDPVSAAGPAHTPAGFKGSHQLHEYWTRGEGLAKWADSPTPWTTLHEHLLKFMPDLEARATAAAWYHDVFGTWPGHHDGGHGVKAKFNPSEARVPGGEHGGEWGSGGGIGKQLEDELGLAGRIHLDPGERLVSSSRLDNSSGSDVDLLFAVVHSPYGNEVRIGAIPLHDAGKWRAEAKGATAGLASDDLRQARTDIAGGAKAADKAAAMAAAAWKAGRAPTDPKMLGVEPVAAGTLGSHGNHDELDWKIYVNDQSSWELSITPTRGEFNGAVLDPTETGDLLTHLGDIQGQLDYSA